MKQYWLSLTLSFLSAVFIAALILPAWINVCTRWKLFDRPDGRKHHVSIIPSQGGIAIFAAFMVSFFLFGLTQGIVEFQALAAALTILFFTGFFDDLTDISAKRKLLVQVAAAAIVTASGLRFHTLNGFIGIYELSPVLQYAITIFVLLFLVNAFNFVDGLDGLATSIALLIFSVFTILFYIQHQYFYVSLCVCMIGALLSFLYYNFYPAKVFMGDTGSLVVGFLIACCTVKLFTIWFASPVISYGPSLTLAALFILIFDLSRVVFIRLSNGISPFKADRSHLHHMVCRQQFGHRGATAILLGFNFLFMSTVFFCSHLRFITFLIFCFCLAIALINSKVIGMVAQLRNKIIGEPRKKLGIDTVR
jgi:UDP-N-acetylmuramyl pentapeptide phosphotransferase/UDP-N-acetylglucosamine-1-phosphate transferase